PESGPERLSLEQLGDEVRLAVVDAHVMEGDHVGVVDRADQPGFPLEPLDEGSVRAELLGDDLDRHLPAEPDVPGAVDLGPPPSPEESDDLVGSQSGAGLQAHGRDLTPPSPATDFPGRAAASRTRAGSGTWLARSSPAPPVLRGRPAGLHLAPAAKPVAAPVDVHPAAVLATADTKPLHLGGGEELDCVPPHGPHRSVQRLLESRPSDADAGVSGRPRLEHQVNQRLFGVPRGTI